MIGYREKENRINLYTTTHKYKTEIHSWIQTFTHKHYKKNKVKSQKYSIKEKQI